MSTNQFYVIIPNSLSSHFNATTSPNSAIATVRMGDYDHALPMTVLDDPAHRPYFLAKKAEGHDIWSFERIEYSPWASFTSALLASDVGQRIIGSPASNLYASLAAALASSNEDSVNVLMPQVATAYQVTPAEKSAINSLISYYDVRVSHLT